MAAPRRPLSPMKIAAGAATRVAASLKRTHAGDRLERGLALMAEPQTLRHPPGVPVRAVKASDDAISGVLPFFMGAGTAASLCNVGFLGFPYLAELWQVAEYRQMSSRMAQEMTRKWIRLRSRSETDKSGRIAQLQGELERLQVQAAFRQVTEVEEGFGRGHIFLDTGATDAELVQPLALDPHKIKKGSLKKLTVVEPMFAYAYDYNASDPLSGGFYEPPAWYVMTRKVSSTRLLTFISRPVPDIMKPVYAFSGMSLFQLAMPTVENFLRMRSNIADIVNNYSLRGIQTNLSGLLAGGTEDMDSIVQRLQIYTQQATNEGMMVLDKDMESFFQHTTPLTNIDKILDQARDNICAVASTPRTVLFGISPEGMNSSSEGELKVYEQYISGMQETLFRHPLEYILSIIELSLFGEVDPDITFDFVPLREMDEKELAEIRNNNAQSDNIYAAMSAVASDEVRAKIAADPTSGWDNLEVSRKVVPATPTPAPNITGSQPNQVGGGA